MNLNAKTDNLKENNIKFFLKELKEINTVEIFGGIVAWYILRLICIQVFYCLTSTSGATLKGFV